MSYPITKQELLNSHKEFAIREREIKIMRMVDNVSRHIKINAQKGATNYNYEDIDLAKELIDEVMEKLKERFPDTEFILKQPMLQYQTYSICSSWA